MKYLVNIGSKKSKDHTITSDPKKLLNTVLTRAKSITLCLATGWSMTYLFNSFAIGFDADFIVRDNTLNNNVACNNFEIPSRY